MNGGEESDGVVVPMKQANKATADQAGAAEFVEGRTPTKENTSQSTCPWHRTGYGRKQGLRGVRQVARECGLTPSFEVGAVCGNSARTDLCGGRSAMAVPTATPTLL